MSFIKKIEDKIENALLDLLHELRFATPEDKKNKKVTREIKKLYNMLSDEKKESLCRHACHRYCATPQLDFMEEYLEKTAHIRSYRTEEQPLLSYLFLQNEELFQHYVTKFKHKINFNDIYFAEQKTRDGVVSVEKNFLTDIITKGNSIGYNNIEAKLYPIKLEELKNINFLEKEQFFSKLRYEIGQKTVSYFINKEKFFQKLHNTLYPSIGFNILVRYMKNYLDRQEDLDKYNHYKEKYITVFSPSQKESIDKVINNQVFEWLVTDLQQKIKAAKCNKREELINIIEEVKEDTIQKADTLRYNNSPNSKDFFNESLAAISTDNWHKILLNSGAVNSIELAQSIKLHYSIYSDNIKDSRKFKL